MVMRNFTLSNIEEEVFNNWEQEQEKKSPMNLTVGGRWTFCFTPTGIGMVVEVNRYNVTN